MKLISFIFSFKNEEKNLEDLTKRIHNFVKKLENFEY
jgi:NADPH-dependent 7-cyano-7-deazaguanine reductase QueF